MAVAKCEVVNDVIAYLNGRILFHIKKRSELRLKILYSFIPRLAVKVKAEQLKIDHYQQKIEIWEQLA